MIKKFLLAVTLAVTSVASFASTGLYVQGDVLPSNIELKADGKWKDSQTGVRVAVGKDTGNIRYQGDYAYLGQLKDTDEDGEKTTVKAHTVGFSAIYDFDTKTALTPYVGARLGVGILNGKISDAEGSASNTEARLGAGVLGGVQYNINSQFAVNAGVEYNFLGKFDDVKFNQYGANIGVRYNF